MRQEPPILQYLVIPGIFHHLKHLLECRFGIQDLVIVLLEPVDKLGRIKCARRALRLQNLVLVGNGKILPLKAGPDHLFEQRHDLIVAQNTGVCLNGDVRKIVRIGVGI